MSPPEARLLFPPQVGVGVRGVGVGGVGVGGVGPYPYPYLYPYLYPYP